MPDKTGRMTPKERVFVKHFAGTGDATYSAAKAGYGAPQVRGSELAHKPAIIEAARAATLERIANEGLPLAINRHLESLRELPPGQALNVAIKMMYQAGGVGEGTAKANKEPHEMTGEELAEAIATLKRAAADKARPIIEHEPESVFD